MDLHLTATGTPGNAAQDIAKQIKTQRNDADDGNDTWPTLAAVRDAVVKATQQYAADSTVQVDVDIKIAITDLTPKTLIEAFNAGEPLPVLSESTPSTRRASSDASAAEPAASK